MSERITPYALQPEQNILKEKLLALCPEIFQDGRLNVEALQSLLPDETETDDDPQEHFGLNWPGKTRARQLALKKPVGSTLKPCPGEGVNEDTTQNIFIEGDNLEVLKLLREAYEGEVKMIYIDPPYNTGKDMIYEDNFSSSVDDYLATTGQKEGKTLLVSNPKSQGRFHTNWLNFMYPRIRIAKELLKEGGVAFVSIDDNEIHNLKSLMNEVFGEENLVGQLTAVTNLKGRNDKKNIAPTHEYILIYQKGDFTSKGLPLTAEQLKQFKYQDEKGEKYGLRDLRKRGGPDRREDRPNMYFPIYYNKEAGKLSLKQIDESDVAIYPMRGDGADGRWRWGLDTVGKYIDILHAKYNKKKDKWGVEHRVYLNPNVIADVEEEEDEDYTSDDVADDDEQEEEVQRTSKSKSFWLTGEISTDVGKRNFKTVFPEADFSFPKAVDLIKRCMYMSLENNDIVLDFFAGSCTTAHAAYELKTKSQYKNIRFICVQLPFPLKPGTKAKEDKKCIQYLQSASKPLNLAEVGKERIRRSAAYLLKKTEQEDPIFAQELGKLDFGFKVYKQSTSNFRLYQPHTGTNTAQLTLSFQQQTEKPLVDGWTKPDLTTELMLLEGFPLHSRQQTQPQYTENEVVAITSDFNENTLYVCLDAQLQDETVDALQIGTDDMFVCLESALTDLQKVRLDDKLKLKTV